METTFVVCSELTVNGHINMKVSKCVTAHSKCKHRENREEKLQGKLIFHIFFKSSTQVLNQTSSNYFSLRLDHLNGREYFKPTDRASNMRSNEVFYDQALNFSRTISAVVLYKINTQMLKYI